MKVLITGGAGFIGRHLALRLVREGIEVTIFDNFDTDVHGGQHSLPVDIASHVRTIDGDVRDREAFWKALDGHEVVVHLAAKTGTGQSMYDVERYQGVNVGGTAILMDYLVNQPSCGIERVVLASSRALYGEGKYQCPSCGVVYPSSRQLADLKAGRFEARCPRCGEACASLPTDEASPSHPSSFYGLTKQVQEQMTMMFARSLGLSAFALRYQNVYGPGQSLDNPYTGILAVFAQRARRGAEIYVFEDGKESRDFVYIDDAIEATLSCIRSAETIDEPLNVGGGHRLSVLEVAKSINRHFGDRSTVSVTGAFRLGDVRHQLADLTRAQARLGFAPRWEFERGLRAFLAWAQGQDPAADRYEQSLDEMRAKRLLHG